jgi:hypothetical protein
MEHTTSTSGILLMCVYIWNITDVTEEIHTLTANATDSAAQNATDQVTVDIVAASEST